MTSPDSRMPEGTTGRRDTPRPVVYGPDDGVDEWLDLLKTSMRLTPDRRWRLRSMARCMVRDQRESA